jgi:hypothetical protein
MAAKMANQMMSDLDPNHTGKVTKDQFISGLASKGVSSADATKMFDAIDTKKTGTIDKSDIETAVKNGNMKPPSGGPQGGPRGAGGAGKPGGAGGAGVEGKSGGTSSTSTNYAAADANQDGVVSAQEDALYAMKHPSIPNTDSTKTSPTKLGKNVDEMA